MRRFLAKYFTGKKYDKDVWFVVKAFAIALLALAIMHAYRPYIMKEAPQEAIVSPGEKPDIVMVHPNEIPALLRGPSSKTTMLMVYASWCPYCRENMPAIADMLRSHKLDHLRIVFVSVDRKRPAFSNYMSKNNYSGLYTAYMVPPQEAASLPEPLREAGSNFRGSIPYIGFFGEDGKLVAEIPGVVDKETLLETALRFK